MQVKRGSELGKKIEAIMKEGGLVPAGACLT
jgi:adenylate kinase family enzyme